MTFILLVLKEWKVSLIVLLSTLLLISIICISQLQNAKDKVKSEFANYITTVEKQNLININKQKQKEVDVLNKQQKIEVLHAKEIKKLQADVVSANDELNSLSKQLTKAKQHINTAPIDQVRSYSSTATELLETCSSRVIYYATKADEHRANETRAIDTYNSLIDTYNTHNTYNQDNKKELPVESP